jgi:hypothetical protein
LCCGGWGVGGRAFSGGVWCIPVRLNLCQGLQLQHAAVCVLDVRHCMAVWQQAGWSVWRVRANALCCQAFAAGGSATPTQVAVQRPHCCTSTSHSLAHAASQQQRPPHQKKPNAANHSCRNTVHWATASPSGQNCVSDPHQAHAAPAVLLSSMCVAPCHRQRSTAAARSQITRATLHAP